FESRRALLDEEAADFIILRFRPYHGDVGERAAGDPHFFAIEDVLVAFFYRARKQAAGVLSELRLGESKAADGFALLQERQPFIFLRVRTKGVNRIHHERRLHRNEAAQSRIATLELLSDESVFDVGHARAPIALQARAEKPELGHLRDGLHGKLSLAVVLLDGGHDFGVDELARALAGELFLVREDRIEVEIIDSGKRWHPISP